MAATAWYVLIGLLLVGIALSGSVLRRLPLTASLIYLGVGIALGPAGAGVLSPQILADATWLERIAEVAVIVSLFTAGLKLRLPLDDARWRPPIRLATLAMLLTIAALTAAGMALLGLPLGAALLLGAVLSPTDPVLASDVQVAHEHDAESLRFSLTGEAGLNDGTAFPFVILGLGLLGAHDLGPGGARWIAVDLLWAVAGGLGIGAACGTAVARLVLYLRREHREAVGLDEFLALGLIASSYGLALLAHAYGFLAVFAAGLAVRRTERRHAEDAPPADVAAAERHGADLPEGGVRERDETQRATDPRTAPAHMAEAVLGFNEQLERLGELGVVLLTGALLASVDVSAAAVALIVLLFVAIRPLATWISLVGAPLSAQQRGYIAWFGVRGIGSLYYLAYAVTHGAPEASAAVLANVTLLAVTASIVVHGVSVTPLMRRYERRTAGASTRDSAA